MLRLSILIPTLSKRAAMLARLLRILQPQLSDDVEVLTDLDDGQRSIGAKRNALLERARGDYIIFPDDDDRVTDDYIAELMDGIGQGVDVVCVNAIHTTDGHSPKLVIDLPYQEWEETPEAYLRGVQIKDAVKREIAITVKFPDISFGEDSVWGHAVEATGLVKTWRDARKVTYFHEYISTK